jgi:clan AA aspartic protease
VIHGVVVGRQARMELLFCLPGGSELAIECVVDTGFEGFLTLPLTVVAELNLPYAGRIDASLADSSNVSTEVYWATILWGGVEREITVLGLGHRPLIGTALLEDHHLSIDFCDGGTVLVDDIL